MVNSKWNIFCFLGFVDFYLVPQLSDTFQEISPDTFQTTLVGVHPPPEIEHGHIGGEVIGVGV